MTKMMKYDNYPIRIVILSNIVAFTIYGSAIFIMLRLSWIAAVLFILYILALEFRLIKYHCTNCYYWGKLCGFGKGKLSSWFFKKVDISKFCAHEMKWKDMIPDLLVSLVPLIIGIILMIIRFDFLILFASILLVLLSTSGNAFIRGSLTCKYCKQVDLGCPAEKLFKKDKLPQRA
jgi:hypothetical protein